MIFHIYYLIFNIQYEAWLQTRDVNWTDGPSCPHLVLRAAEEREERRSAAKYKSRTFELDQVTLHIMVSQSERIKKIKHKVWVGWIMQKII